MKQKRIQKLFNKHYNNMTNPAFPIPVLYFQHKQYYCEVAVQMGKHCCRWTNYPFKVQDPLLIFEMLFAGNTKLLTVLEKDKNGNFNERSDLFHYFIIEKELTSIINKYLN